MCNGKICDCKKCGKSAQTFRLTLKLSIDSHPGSSPFNSFVFRSILQQAIGMYVGY